MVLSMRWLFNFEGTSLKSVEDDEDTSYYKIWVDCESDLHNPVTIAERLHLFPSRTQKLSSLALKILGGKLPGKLGRRRFFLRPHGQAVKTSPFHGGNPGSIPGGVTTN